MLIRPNWAVNLLLLIYHFRHTDSEENNNGVLYFPGDTEKEVDLLVPLETRLNNDAYVFRAKGIDSLPAVGMQRGVHFAVPYRLYLPKEFFPEFSILVTVKPMDERGGYLFAVVNSYDTTVDLGLLIEPAGGSQFNISLVVADTALCSFLVPQFVHQWAQFSLEVTQSHVNFFFKCVRYAAREVRFVREMNFEDSTKLYIGSAGPLRGMGFEGALQELKIIDDAGEAARQCDNLWWRRRKQQQYLTKHPTGVIKWKTSDEGSGKSEEGPQPIRVLTTEKSSEETARELPTEGPTFIVDTQPDRGDLPDQIPGDPFTTFAPTQRISPTAFPPTPPLPPYPPFQETSSSERSNFPNFQPSSAGQEQVCQQVCKDGEQGPKGEMGPMGPPGRDFERLTDDDINRIANQMKMLQDNKVDSSLPTNNELPPYDPNKHRSTLKGEKGERGERGPPGETIVQQTVPNAQPLGQPGVLVYSTTVELFATGKYQRTGTLAFASSTQQLFIRVDNGWKEIMLGAFHPIVEHRPSQETSRQDTPLSDSQRQHPLAPPTTPYQSYQPTADFQQPHQPRADARIHLIALNTPFDGYMRGLRGADLLCYREARLAGFKTTFRALLSNEVQDVLRIVHSADMDTPIVNLRGEKLYQSWRALLNDGERTDAPIYSFSRRDVMQDFDWPEKKVWHGSMIGGTRAGEFCEGWRNRTNLISAFAGDLSQKVGLFSEAKPLPCNQKLIILCVENMSKYHSDKILRRKKMSLLEW